MNKDPISAALAEKYARLKALLKEWERVLVAFSGGVDSTFLLKVAHDVLGGDVLAVIATSETYPEKETQEAVLLAESMNVPYRVIQSCEMENPDFVSNPPDRCYHCKMELFSRLRAIADEENIPYVLDGANFEDTGDYRPGSKAAEERELSRHRGLPTWDKPAMPCLSSRFPYYTKIQSQALLQIAQAEEFLRSLGLSQLRVRHHESIARIEVPPGDIPGLVDSKIREAIVGRLKGLGYTYVTLDLAGYRSGSLNETLSEDEKIPK